MSCVTPSTSPTAAPRGRGRGRRIALWSALAGSILLAIVAVVVLPRVVLSSETVRQRLVASLSERLDGEVELGDLSVRAFPRFHAEASGLTVHHKNRRDVPPLIAIKKLSVDTGALDLWRKRVGKVTLEGLEINISPRPDGDDKNGDDKNAGDKNAGDRNAGHRNADTKDYVIDRLLANDARVVIIPREKHKTPKVWAIHDLDMRDVSFARPMPFEATLTNGVPPGEIAVKGSFGPWGAEDPGTTPLEGKFTFADADLSVFKGISGLLSSHGEFGGSLGRLSVHGITDTPDFTIKVGGHPLPLHAEYRTTIDGTNGNTWLDRIDGSFLNTSLVAKGSVIDAPGKEGRTVALDITMDNARLEDVLRLAVKAPKAPMTGALKLQTKFVLPPGEQDVVEKLQLDGQFSIAGGKFTHPDVQQKINELSRRSSGKTPDPTPASVASDFRGRFKLGGGTLALAGLEFNTPGAKVQLDGTYDLRQELLNFKGMLLMDASMSETQKGWKRMILKQFDPIFAKEDGSGTALPIKIDGKRSEPAFGLDKGRLFKRAP